MVITSWDRYYPEGISWSEPLGPPVSLDYFLESSAGKWPDRVALDYYDRKFTFWELHDLASRMAKGLQSLGVKPGDHVGLHLPNMPQYVVGLFGVWMAGGVVVNFSPLAPTAILEAQVADSETRVMVTSEVFSVYSQIAPLKGTSTLETLVVCSLNDLPPAPTVPGFSDLPAARDSRVGNEIKFTELVDNDGQFKRPPRADLRDEIAVLQYTGGTTGEPKAAMLTHANFSAAIRGYERWGWAADPVNGSYLRRLSVVPLGHVYGLSSCLAAIATGAEFLVYLRADAARILSDIERKKVVVVTAVPSTYVMLVEQARLQPCDLSSLRYCIGGGAALAGEILDRFKRLTGLTPMVGYGLTETTTAGGVHPMKGNGYPGTAGLPPPSTVVEIVDLEDGMTLLPMGESGEICISGPQVMKGYWKRPQETAHAFRGGRFHTGDIGFIDGNGYLTVVDRQKDVILCGGYNVFPRNIEEALHRHPSVAEAAVIGVPDVHLGQHAKALIVLKPGQKPFGYSELRSFLREELDEYEIPLEMELRDSLPHTATGKIAKRELTERPSAQKAATAPVDSIESQLVRIWEQILEKKSINVRDNFFDLGGHSLAAARLIMQVEETFGRTPSLAQFLIDPTIERLARMLRDAGRSTEAPLPQVVFSDPGAVMKDTVLTGLKNRFLQVLALYSPGAESLRVWLHRLRGVRIGPGVFIGTSVILETSYPQLVSIGAYVTLSARALVIAHFKETVSKAKSTSDASVRIEDHVWIGPGAIILPNVTIGRGAVVAAGSVVKASVPPLTMVEGNPARQVARCGVPLNGNSYEEFIRNLKPL